MIGELDVGRLIRQDVVPLTVVYVLFLVAMARHLRARRRGPVAVRRPRGPVDVGRLARHLAITAAGGYVVFLAVILLFYVVLGASTHEFAAKAAVRGGLLAVVAVLLLLGIAAVGGAARSPRRDPGEPTDR